jgi:hypothetical protein
MVRGKRDLLLVTFSPIKTPYQLYIRSRIYQIKSTLLQMPISSKPSTYVAETAMETHGINGSAP